MSCIVRPRHNAKIIDFSTRRRIGEGAIYLQPEDEIDEDFHIPTFLEMKLGTNNTARRFSPPTERADYVSPASRPLTPRSRGDLPPVHTIHDVDEWEFFGAFLGAAALAIFLALLPWVAALLHALLVAPGTQQ